MEQRAGGRQRARVGEGERPLRDGDGDTCVGDDADLEAPHARLGDGVVSAEQELDLGEGGVNLSGGQKQRIAIARTLLKKSKIILMDEATSALDNASQKVIKDSIDALAKDHTVLIVAHRLSTIIDSDEIYVISNGKVLDHGTHESLMKSCKYYQKLHTVEDKIV